LGGTWGALDLEHDREAAGDALWKDDVSFRSLLRHVLDVVAVLDADGTLRYASPAVEATLGYAPEEVTGTNVFEYVHPDDLERALEAFAETLAIPGTLPPLEFRARHADGLWRHVEVVRNNRLGDPGVCGVVITIRDVTRRKESEAEMEALRREYEEIVGSVEAIIWKGDARTLRFTFVSDQAEAILGYPPERWTSEPSFWQDHIHPEDREWAVSFCRRAVNEKADHDFEYRMISADGDVVWLRDIVRVEAENGVPTRVFGVMVDVTERKGAQREAEQLGHRNQLILDSAGEGIYGLDQEGKTTFVNPAAAALTGFDPAELIGKDQHEIIHHSRPDGTPYPREECRIHAAIWDGRVRQIENEVFWRKDGTSFPVEYTSTPILEEGEVVGTVVTFTDTTERRGAEEALKESEGRYRALMEQSVEAIYLFDAETKRVLESNAAFRRLVGYAEGELLGMRIYNFIAHDDADIDRHVRRSVEEKRRRIGEREYRRKDGSVMVVDTSASVISYAGRTAICAVSRDITERKEAEEALRRSEARLAEAQRLAHLGGWEWDVHNDEILWSDEVYRIYGLEPQECAPGFERFIEIVHPDDRDLVTKTIDEAFEGNGLYDIEHRVVRPDGSVRVVHRRAEVVREDGGEPLKMIGTVHDITERKEAEERLRAAEERYRTVVEEQTELVCRFLPDLTVTFANEAYCRYFGRASDEVIGNSFIERVPVEDRVYYEELSAKLNEENPSRTVEHRVITPDGEGRWQQWTDTAIFDSGGRIVEYQAVGRDVTERRALEERLEYQALHDSLTGLPNRRSFVDRLGQALRRTRRKQNRVAVLFMDLDGFKVVNDSLGHDAGDRLLVKVAERLRGCLRPEDTLARFGGDEFTVLIEDVEVPDGAVRVAERIVEELREPFTLDRRELYVAASIGVALGSEGTRDAEELLREADTSMYRAKDRGTGHEVFDPAMYGRAVDRLDLENDLRRAIEEDEFVVHYQPIVSLQTGELWGMEALVRWEHPERGLLDPGEFVPVAEESGLVVPMGELVLEEACRRAVEWQRGFPRLPPLAMSVNLSGRQLRRPDLHEVVGRALADTGLPASSLGLDITETVYIGALDANTAALDRLRALGIRVSLDDFGSGYSSLSYLKRLPADILKIDKSFTRGLGLEAEDTAIVQTVVDLAHILGMEVVAEGVETEGQVALLREMGCDFAQGYYISKPLPSEAASTFLTSAYRDIAHPHQPDSLSDGR
jgi:diguanylate cyclase (GGDEF)-like protein/PAS domain S-box-containing protein